MLCGTGFVVVLFSFLIQNWILKLTMEGEISKRNNTPKLHTKAAHIKVLYVALFESLKSEISGKFYNKKVCRWDEVGWKCFSVPCRRHVLNLGWYTLVVGCMSMVLVGVVATAAIMLWHCHGTVDLVRAIGTKYFSYSIRESMASNGNSSTDLFYCCSHIAFTNYH